ncbi:MAG: NAD-dependent epimerase/dehydratase family protein [Silvanigrellales bacterium]|nr:NAD-dependent epimerase/dehydratase family protein [Silvanigrellales bacterium]
MALASPSWLGNRAALIGHTGFVGSHLSRQFPFSHVYNSKNIHEMCGERFDTIVCAGVPAVKWWANRNPEADWANIVTLLESVERAHATRFVLISTVDVYPEPRGVTEATGLTPGANHAYGRHRLAVEHAITAQFQKKHILRLPGVFGQGLKKNVIFDLLNDNGLDAINPDSVFQYYSLERLGDDLTRVVLADLPLVNLCSEGVPTSEFAERFFPQKKLGAAALPAVTYDVHTQFADVWGREGNYQFTKDTVFEDLARYIVSQTK